MTEYNTEWKEKNINPNKITTKCTSNKMPSYLPEVKSILVNCAKVAKTPTSTAVIKAD